MVVSGVPLQEGTGILQKAFADGCEEGCRRVTRNQCGNGFRPSFPQQVNAQSKLCPAITLVVQGELRG